MSCQLITTLMEQIKDMLLSELLEGYLTLST